MSERHLTVEQLADRLQVSVKTIYKWNYKGSGPKAIKVGRFRRYRLRDVVTWENKRVAS